MDADIFQIANAIRIFKGLTITKLASEIKINRGNLNAWLNSGSPDRLSSDKIKTIFNYLGIDLEPLHLRPGIHRFTIPKPTYTDVRLISVIHDLFPEGGTVYPVRKESYSQTLGGYEFDNETFFSGIQEIIWVAVPKLIHDARVIFKMGVKTYQLKSTRGLPKPFCSGPWHFADNSNSKSNGGRDLPDQVFLRLAYDESLTVPELDKILFNSSPYEGLLLGNSIAAEEGKAYSWTWERLVSSLKKQGKTPGEVAKKLGL